MSSFTKILGFPFRLIWSPICFLYYIPIVFFAKVGDSTRKNGWLMFLGILLFLWPIFLILAILKSFWMAITYAFSNTSKDDYIGLTPEKTYSTSNYESTSYSASDIRNNCYTCHGSGFKECWQCSGSGIYKYGLSGKRACSNCNGKGVKVCKHY
jgi:hypothetical protein